MREEVGSSLDPLKLIERSTEELHKRIEMQRHILITLLKRKKSQNSLDVCLLFDCPHRKRLKETIKETVVILEETRKSFKSKTLENLRKRLLQVLLEE